MRRHTAVQRWLVALIAVVASGVAAPDPAAGATPVISLPVAIVRDPIVEEGQVARFPVSLSESSQEPVAVGVATTSGEFEAAATPGVDFTPVSATLVFQAGETQKVVEVRILDDDEDEFEFVGLTLSNPVNGTLGNASMRFRLLDNPSSYRLVASNSSVYSFGVPFRGPAANQRPRSPAVGLAPTAGGGGYWIATADGGVYAYGDAPFLGSLGGVALRSPVVGIASTPNRDGYWLATADGGVYAFGHAVEFHGSVAGQPLRAPIVGIAVAQFGRGYWLVAADGGVFAFGEAQFMGSMGGVRLNSPIVGMAPSPFGVLGYWLVAADGGVFAFGDAAFAGSMGGRRLAQPVRGIKALAQGGGYWLAAADGGVFTFGAARFRGSAGGVRLDAPVVAIG